MKSAILDKVAWIGGEQEPANITGIILTFAGLGGTVPLKAGLDDLEQTCADNGALIVHPYHDPWAWLNPATVTFVDDLVSSVREKYNLSDSLPLLSTGGSMGGHGALNYCVKTKHAIARCFANCPVTDLVFHYGERPDLPRTFHASYDRYDDSLFELLRANSPASNPEELPDIDYLIVHGQRDDAVSKALHSDILVPKMLEIGRRVTYITPPEMGHCGPLDDITKAAVLKFILDGLSRSLP